LGAAVDVWASGILFYTILFGQQPFVGSSEPELQRKIIKCNIKFPKSSHPTLRNRAALGKGNTYTAEQINTLTAYPE
jgi:serine/threonine protein kinase